VASARKTGRCVIVHEATRTSGFGAELAALVQEHCFYHLEVPIERVTGWDTPYPHALEWAYFPGPAAWRPRCAVRWRPDMTGIRVIKVPDVGEGIAEVELVAWHVKPGDTVTEDQGLADVMTDKASVEIPSPVAGRVLALGGEVGQMLAVGADLIRIETAGAGLAPAVASTPAPPAVPAAATARRPVGAQASQTRRHRSPRRAGPRRPPSACRQTARSPRPRCAGGPGSSAST